MESFLEKTVIHLCKQYNNDVGELCIVLPNRRAGLFLKKHFARHLNNTFWSPEIFAIEDFVALLSGLEITDSTTLLFELYETIKQVNGPETENFDEFSKWGAILLNDINEIDRYLVDAERLFGNLKDIKELETWSLNNEEGLTDFQKQYLNFWKLLGDYYKNFEARLLKKRIAYQGLTYKLVVQNPSEKVNPFPWKKIIFAGFNALNKAEEKIIEQLLASGKAEIIWDADKYYVEDVKQEAGRFIRKYLSGNIIKKFPDANVFFNENLLAGSDKKISIIGTAKNIAQAKVAGSIIADFYKAGNNMQDTALVMADENLLFPVLHSLPEGLSDINVTMGYPLKNTPVAGFFDLLFDMHVNAIKLNNGKEKYSFYHKDLLKLLNHPYASLMANGNDGAVSLKPLIKALQERNIVFASRNLLESVIKENVPDVADNLHPLFKYWQHPNDAIDCIYSLIEILKDTIISQRNTSTNNVLSLELEYLFAITKIAKQIQNLMKEYAGAIDNAKALQTIYKQIVRNATLPFYGEPLMGLQVMGMLETRTLDFENVVLLSCNEDILPAGKVVNSFVPHELKRYFGLPTYADKDAVFAYHFYRLLQRAKNIYLLYNTETDAQGSGEKSRFLTQLAYELPRVNKNIVIEESLVSLPVQLKENNNVIIVKKDSVVMERLKNIADYGFSPSALNKYRNCSLQFYFHAIAGLKEEDEIEEIIGADVLGNAIHEVLEILYTPFIGRVIAAADVKAFKEKVETLTVEVFEKQYSKTEIRYGKNLLTVKIAIKFINNFLDAESKAIEAVNKYGSLLTIKALEAPLESTIEINGLPVKLKGKADRVDAIGSTIRIIDYKTGIAANKELKFDDWPLIQTDATLAKSFQLLMYALLYKRMNPATDKMQSGIITFRELSAGLKTVKINSKDELNVELINSFETQLHVLLSDLFDETKNFEQTHSLENCEYCSFKGICNR